MELKHSADDPSDSAGGDDPQLRLRKQIEHAAHLLPAQGPITVFIHHNTLHAFEGMTFDEAVQRGGQVFGCEPYLTEERYRNELRKGRIRLTDLESVLQAELGEDGKKPVFGTTTRLAIRQAMLERPIWSATAAELEYFLAETAAIRRFREDVPTPSRLRLIGDTHRWVMRDLRGRMEGNSGWVADLLKYYGVHAIETWSEETWESITLESLWRTCIDGVAHAEPATKPPARKTRPRDLLLRATGADADRPVNELLTRFCASFLDQGISNWPLPDRSEGLFRSFLRTYSRPVGPVDGWLRPLAKEARRLLVSGMDALTSAHESLEILGVEESEWDDYLSESFLSLRGWAGMVREVENRGDRVAQPIPPGSLEGFVAIRLLLERLSAQYVAQADLGYSGPLAELHTQLPESYGKGANGTPVTATVRAFQVFQLAQLLGWPPSELSRLSTEGWAALFREVESFGNVERRRIFHQAYERKFRTQVLDAIGLHQRHQPAPGSRTRFQVVTCLDEREESFRRHIEEVAPDCETFGVAGFFNVVMYYRGAADAHFVPLCPIVLTPKHWVEEQVDDQHAADDARRRKARQTLGGAANRLTRWSHSFAVGALITGCVGALATIPLVGRILFPRLTGRLRRRMSWLIETPTATRLKLARVVETPGRTGESLGFTVAEMSDIGERFLRDIGLISNFAPLVFLLGHGSDSVNNPHKSAYDCGACGGSPGGPNGRAIAEILNHSGVRERIAQRGITIPAGTHFIGGYHNTCDDSVALHDTDRIPETQLSEYLQIAAVLDESCKRNSHERSRRFMSAKLDQSFDEARIHVENRSEDLAQVRPELGHATNAICIVGRRNRSRGLYFDRRAFLTSYDPTQDDPEGSTLGRLLGAAVPVCAGINLEYYFSHVDSQGYGCGTKLPHNVASLLGVMDGALSDLRTGLPWQMVEIHEPVRLLFVVEVKQAVLERVMNRVAVVGNMIRNGWVQMTILDPDSNEIRVYRDGQFVLTSPSTDHLPTAPSSAEWYRGWRDHLDFAEILPGA